MRRTDRFTTRSLRTLSLIALLLALLFVFPVVPSAAQETVDNGTEEIEELESFDDFEIVEADPVPGPAELAGRMHPAMVHFPIGWITLVLLLDLLALVLGRRELEAAGLWALGLGVLAFAPAIASGLLRADSLTVSAGIYYPVELHRNLAFLVLLICLAALLTRIKGRKNLTGAVKWVYLALMVAAAGLIGFVGHLGGKMVYGENFLPF
jgi:uncharacterized membrane protein